ncbi:DnaD domain protein [Bacteroides caecimuris]|uniref:DnaD domain-containing protein n=1 Tax=Bacteroides caecimuris TaxID=1796613 RepID=UPI0026581218|nr:DnaD domain protein [Bacteroides caecimuris]
MEDKFDSFYKDLQTLFGSRLLSQNEIREYMQFVESSSMEKNAFIAIVQYCIGIKGSDISSAYILKVAKYFAQDDILTVEQVEKKLSEKSNGECGQKKEASSQEEYLIKLFRKLNPQLKKNVINIVKGLTTSLDNK